MNVDRPTGNPNIESGAGLLPQLVKEEGSHVEVLQRNRKGLQRAGRKVRAMRPIWWVSKVR